MEGNQTGHILPKNNAREFALASKAHGGSLGSQTENTPRKRDPQQSARHLVTMAATRRHFFLGSLCGTLPGSFAGDNRLGS